MYMEAITIKYTRNSNLLCRGERDLRKKLRGLVTTSIPVPMQNSSVATGIVMLTQFHVEWCFYGHHFVGNKGKRRNSKRVLQENKARQIFPKTNISYPLDTRTYVLCFLVTSISKLVPLTQYQRVFNHISREDYCIY